VGGVVEVVVVDGVVVVGALEDEDEDDDDDATDLAAVVVVAAFVLVADTVSFFGLVTAPTAPTMRRPPTDATVIQIFVRCDRFDCHNKKNSNTHQKNSHATI
jgi:hypothetical protein